MLEDESIRQALYDLWIDKGVVVFRNTDGLDTHIRLSHVFGSNEEHPLLRGVDVPQEDKISIHLGEEQGSQYEIDGEMRRPVHARHIARPPLAHLEDLFKVSQRFSPDSGCHHFLRCSP